MREGVPPLADQISAFLDDLALAGRSPATVRTYAHFVRQLLQAEPRDVLRRYAGVLRSAQTAHNALAAFARWQLDQHYVTASPMARMPFPRGRHRAPKPFLTAAEVRALYGACRTDSERLMIRLLLTGMRVSELCGARQSDLRGDRLHIRGKGGRPRSVLLDPESLLLIQPGPRIFPRTPNAVRACLKTLGRLAGVPNVTPHSFRRTMASQALLAGMDARHVRTLGGWESERTFAERYVAYVLEDAAVDAARRARLTERLLESP
jgi:integrase